jgi:hypothetical protein
LGRSGGQGTGGPVTVTWSAVIKVSQDNPMSVGGRLSTGPDVVLLLKSTYGVLAADRTSGGSFTLRNAKDRSLAVVCQDVECSAGCTPQASLGHVDVAGHGSHVADFLTDPGGACEVAGDVTGKSHAASSASWNAKRSIARTRRMSSSAGHRQ